MVLYLFERIQPKDDDTILTDGRSPVSYSIPHYIGKELPLTCECGYQFAITTTLTDWYCPNPYCYKDNASLAVKVFEKAHKKMDIGNVIAEDIMLHNQFHRHMELICITDVNQIPSKYSLERRQRWVDGLKELRTNVKFSEFIEYFQIDGIGATTSAYTFAGISNYKELEDLIRDNPTEFRKQIAKANGFADPYNEATTGIYTKIVTFMPLLNHFSQFFTFEEQVGKLINISMTGSFSQFSPRAKFFPWLNENYAINAQSIPRYSGKVDILLYEEDSNSAQRIRAEKDGRAMHIDDFLAKIEPIRKENLRERGE